MYRRGERGGRALYLVLGRERLAQTDRSALDWLRRLCCYWGARTHWDAGSDTLYIGSPCHDRLVAVTTGTPDHPAAAGVVEQVREHLRQGGACLNAQPLDLALRLNAADEGQPGIWAAYAWAQWNPLRALAVSLSDAVGRAARLPVRAVRPTLEAGNDPLISIRMQSLPTDPAISTRIAGAIMAGLHMHWEDSMPEEVPYTVLPPWEPLGETRTEPDRLILDPDPSIVPPTVVDVRALALLLSERSPQQQKAAAAPLPPTIGLTPSPPLRTQVVATFHANQRLTQDSVPHTPPAGTPTLPFQRAETLAPMAQTPEPEVPSPEAAAEAVPQPVPAPPPRKAQPPRSTVKVITHNGSIIRYM